MAVVRPGYPAYRNILTALGLELVEIPCGPETRYQPTPELLDAAVAEHGEIAGLVLASPANPTGTMAGREELTALHGWCRRNDALLISDEIYHGIAYPEPGAVRCRAGLLRGGRRGADTRRRLRRGEGARRRPFEFRGGRA